MKNSSLAHISFRAILFGTCALVVSSAVQAQVIDWDNTSGNDAWYDRIDNWVGGSPPTSTQTARFNQAATYDVWWDNLTSTQNPEVGFLQILQGDVTFDNRDEEASTQYLYTINGSGGTGAFSDFSISGSGTSLTNRGLHLHSLGSGEVLGGATLTLDGSDPNGAKLTVGGLGFSIGGNLNIQSGGTFDNNAGYIGRISGSTGIATVTGSGSQWNNSSVLYLGSAGNGTLNVEAGGLVSSNFESYIGYFSGSTGVATVTGSGSQWNNSGSLYLGYSGNGTLNVEAGGLVSNTAGYIGRFSGSTGIATVTGFGSQWNNSNGLFLGGTSTTDGGMGSLSIQNQGQVNVGNDLNPVSGQTGLTISDTGSNGNLWVRNSSIINNTGWGRIGLSSGSTGIATVTGSGSQWNNSSGLYVGNRGNGTLNVEAGGLVSSNFESYIGSFSGSTGIATVTGSGSQWNNSQSLYLGEEGNGTLNVEAGGLVSNTAGFIGLNSSSTGVATVTGSGSQWNNSGSLYLGYSGNGTLNVEAGGLVSNTEGYIGRISGSTGIATVTGSGSQWNNSGSLYVGKEGNGTLNVEAGGLVSNTAGYIGLNSSSTGVATVTGSGSQWNNSNFLSVGDEGNGTLNVEAGGLVSNTEGYIGLSSGSTGIATVTGSGSQWNNSRSLYVGVEGNGTLNVEAGGLVSNTAGYIGRISGSTGIATVTGSGSQWNNSGSLYLGYSGNGTLNVEAGGLVSNTEGYIGRFSGSTGIATVTGSGSQWNNSGSLYLGYSGNGTLNVEAGGLVSNTAGYIGRISGSTGIATVTGSGSQWNNSNGLFLGGTSTTDGGMGSLSIQNQGQVNVGNDLNSSGGTELTISDTGSNGNLWVRNSSIINNTGWGRIGLSSGSTGIATVTGSGSQWDNSSGLYVGAGGNGTLNVEAGGLVSNTAGYIGRFSGSTGIATVTGSGSQWNNSNFLSVGDGGNGTLNVEAGGLVSSTEGYIGFYSGSTGIATVTGSGSQWNNSGSLYVGDGFNGTLNVEAGGLVSSNFESYIGYFSGSTGVATVTGSGSQWNNSGSLYLGYSGNGTLNVEAGGLVSNTAGYIGRFSGSTGIATVTGFGSQWNNSNGLFLGGTSTTDGGMGSLSIQNQGQVNVGNDLNPVSGQTGLTISDTGSNGNLWVRNSSIINNTGWGRIGLSSGSTGIATVTGSGSQWDNSSGLYVGNGGNGTLNVEAGGLVSNFESYIGRFSGSTGIATVTGSGSQWNNSNFLSVGEEGNGTLNVEAGGLVSNTEGYIGYLSGSTGIATVTGSGSQWNNSNFLSVGVGGNGTLNVEAGGLVSNFESYIGRFSGSTGIATVTGSGSQWNNSGSLYLGYSGNGTLNVEAGGLVSNTAGYIGRISGSTGIATVTGSGSQWNNTSDLIIGGVISSAGGDATLNIADDGLVTVGETTRIWAGSNVNLTGGRFEFGTTTMEEFGIINGVSGSMAGDVIHSGYTDVATLTPFQNPGVDLTEVRVSNSGTLYGNGSLGTALWNNADGEVETVVGERMRFTGVGSTNAGEINNFGGQIRFDQDLTNQSGGLMGGRGQFFSNGGWTNDGVIAMSGGFADVHGDLSNTADGIIAIGGGSTTTFYDDVTMDAANLNVEIASDSYGVFFGSYNGGNDGLGTVQAFGDLRPGNSPAVVSFGGDLEMGVNTATYIELGGLLGGEFDQLQIAGDFLLDGSLDVSLIDNFSLGFQQEFLIADIMGSRTGLFDGLSEGDLIGNYGGTDLFISYRAGNGNDISFFTSVPEPGVVGLLGSLMLGLVMRRRRRRAN